MFLCPIPSLLGSLGSHRRDAGFIDNVLGSTVEFEGSGLGQKTNSNLVEEDINEVEWTGGEGSNSLDAQ